MSEQEALLRVVDLCVAYGEVKALEGISLDVYPKEVVTLLGANGSGKSTTLKAIAGQVRPTSGAMEFRGQPIQHLSPQAIYRLGLVHVQEGRRIFPGLSARDNLLLGAANRQEERNDWTIRADLEGILDLFPPLKPVLGRSGWMLSGGQQQMLAVGQGLMARPKLLMLDEPSLGLAPVLVQDLFKAIRRINEQGTTILLVEQNVRMALRIATRGYVLELGRISAAGTAEELSCDPRIQAAYLGGRAGV